MFNEYPGYVNQDFFELLELTYIDYDMLCFLLGDGQ